MRPYSLTDVSAAVRLFEHDYDAVPFEAEGSDQLGVIWAPSSNEEYVLIVPLARQLHFRPPDTNVSMKIEIAINNLALI